MAAFCLVVPCSLVEVTDVSEVFVDSIVMVVKMEAVQTCET
jgi:hypothetical protein